MVSRTQVDRLAQRIERLAGGRTDRMVVLFPGETEEEALRRSGLVGRTACNRVIFIQTGVPRSRQWLLGNK
jgi:hypothetical protein